MIAEPYCSKVLASVHGTEVGLHGAGVTDAGIVRWFVRTCLKRLTSGPDSWPGFLARQFSRGMIGDPGRQSRGDGGVSVTRDLAQPSAQAYVESLSRAWWNDNIRVQG